jgi:hypothetical protein
MGLPDIRHSRRPREARAARYATQVSGLRYRAKRDILGRPDFVIWSFAVIDDLRGWEDRSAP